MLKLFILIITFTFSSSLFAETSQWERCVFDKKTGDIAINTILLKEDKKIDLILLGKGKSCNESDFKIGAGIIIVAKIKRINKKFTQNNLNIYKIAFTQELADINGLSTYCDFKSWALNPSNKCALNLDFDSEFKDVFKNHEYDLKISKINKNSLEITDFKPYPLRPVKKYNVEKFLKEF